MIKTGDIVEFRYETGPGTGIQMVGVVYTKWQDVLVVEPPTGGRITVLRQDCMKFDPAGSVLVDRHMQDLEMWCQEIKEEWGDDVNDIDIIGDTLPNYCASELGSGPSADALRAELYRRNGRDLPWS